MAPLQALSPFLLSLEFHPPELAVN